MKAFDQETSPPFRTNGTDIVKCLKSGMSVAKIQHPISKVWVLLGAYTNRKEASESCAAKKLEYESNPQQNSNLTDYEKQPGVKPTRSGKREAAIKHNNTQKEAAEAFRMSRIELNRGLVQGRRVNSRSVTHVKKAVNKAGYHKRKSGHWRAEIWNLMTKAKVHLGCSDTADEAQEAHNKKKREFGLLACDKSKQNPTVEDGKSNSNCGSDKTFVPMDGSSMMNVNAAEFDLGVVDSYGRLIGEYSSIDDDLWIC